MEMECFASPQDERMDFFSLPPELTFVFFSAVDSNRVCLVANICLNYCNVAAF